MNISGFWPSGGVEILQRKISIVGLYSTEENMTKLLLSIKEDILLFKFPFFIDGATFVYVNVFVRSFSAINDVKMVGFLLSIQIKEFFA